MKRKNSDIYANFSKNYFDKNKVGWCFK